jgi:hypothetical protein
MFLDSPCYWNKLTVDGTLTANSDLITIKKKKRSVSILDVSTLTVEDNIVLAKLRTWFLSDGWKSLRSVQLTNIVPNDGVKPLWNTLLPLVPTTTYYITSC